MKQNKKKLKGSLTVEAALITPICFYAMMVVLYLFQVIFWRGYIYQGAYESNKELGVYAFLLTTKQVKMEGSVEKILGKLGCTLDLRQKLEADRLNHSCIKGGSNGIHTIDSTFLEDGENIEILPEYVIELPVMPLFRSGNKFTGHMIGRAFIGENSLAQTKEDAEEDIIVFITETGSVYHYSRECTYLNLSTRAVTGGEVGDLRSNDGSRYKPCERCHPGWEVSGADTLYITDDGDRYHSDKNCSGLKRTVQEIELSKVGNRHSCSRCSKGK
ncbi:MAG: hypothetical protein K6G65_07040 [Lachnospiraceae bacterium]|nr:hypothetical protein [Lachnospiraceae bacterium]